MNMRQVASSTESASQDLYRGTEIASIECFPITLRLRKPLVMSTYRIDHGPVLFVKVRTKDGHVGWGEAAADPIMSGETLTGMVAALRQYAEPYLLNKSALDRRRLIADLQKSMYGNRGMLAALDIALVDVVGKLRGVPAVEVLGGAMRHKALVLSLIGGTGSIDADVTDAVSLAAQGYKAFKLKVGVAPVKQEIQAVKELREALGADALLAADANMAWDVPTTLAFTAGTAEFDLAFLEQPCRAGDVARAASVAAASRVSIGIDESLHSRGDLLAHVRENAVRGASLKTIKLGGITPLTDTAQLCDSLGLSVNLAMMMESGLATSAMLHAACAIPQLDWAMSMGSSWIADDLIQPPPVEDGYAICSGAPGLGVEVDEVRLLSMTKP